MFRRTCLRRTHVEVFIFIRSREPEIWLLFENLYNSSFYFKEHSLNRKFEFVIRCFFTSSPKKGKNLF